MRKKIAWKNGNPKNEQSKKKNGTKKKPKKELKMGKQFNHI
jgi:hypothetical protein